MPERRRDWIWKNKLYRSSESRGLIWVNYL